MHCGDHGGHANLFGLCCELSAEPAVETYDLSRFIAAHAIGKLIRSTVGFRVRKVPVKIHIGQANAVAGGVVIGFLEVCPCKGCKVTVGRTIHEGLGIHGLSA